MNNSVFQSRTGHMTIWSVRIACLITKTTNTHSEYVILIVFPLQQWLYERTSLLRCTYIACLVFYVVLYKISHLGLSDIKRPASASNSPLTSTSRRIVCLYQITIQQMLIPIYLFVFYLGPEKRPASGRQQIYEFYITTGRCPNKIPRYYKEACNICTNPLGGRSF